MSRFDDASLFLLAHLPQINKWIESSKNMKRSHPKTHTTLIRLGSWEKKSGHLPERILKYLEKNSIHRIGSMGMVELPTFTIEINHSCRHCCKILGWFLSRSVNILRFG